MIPNRIPLNEWMERCEKFFKEQGEFSNTTAAMVNEMFDLYNDKNLPREHGKGCGGCRARVFKRLKSDYERRKQG